MCPLYIPSWPPGEHLLSGVGCWAGKCKIRPADERLTIISIHNGSKICQIFPDLNIPATAKPHFTFSKRWRFATITNPKTIWIWLWQLSPFDWNDCDCCHLDIETIDGCLPWHWNYWAVIFLLGSQGNPPNMHHPMKNTLILRQGILLVFVSIQHSATI